MTIDEMFQIFKDLRKSIKTGYFNSIILYNGDKYLEWKIIKETMNGTEDTGIGGVTTILKQDFLNGKYGIDAIELTEDDEIIFMYDSHDGYQRFCFTKKWVF